MLNHRKINQIDFELFDKLANKITRNLDQYLIFSDRYEPTVIRVKMICKLCKEREANKKNTHYLTDSIIRTCLNLDGSNERESGFYFDISNDTPFIDFNFQRGTSVTKLEESLGREATEEEIEKAKEIPFSVDNIFCSDCEDIFTSVETPFIESILPRFRQTDLTGVERIEIAENKTAKLFFYLQVWRTAICEASFDLSEPTMEGLRTAILNSDSIDNEELPNFPFHVTYLQTVGDEMAYTNNFVGYTNDRNPNIIFMNDFVIQFFEDESLVRSINFYGLNQSNDLNQFINANNERILIKVLPNQTRLEITQTINRQEKVQRTMSYLAQSFSKQWFLIFRGFPNQYLIEEYLQFVTAGDFDVLRYTRETIVEKTTEFIESKLSR